MQHIQNWIIEEEKENEPEEISEVLIVENFPKLMTNIKPQIQKIQRLANKINTEFKIR